MGSRIIGRPTSPDTARHIWSQIQQMQDRGKAPTVDNIAQGIGGYYNWNMDEVRVKIFEALDSGIIRRSNPSATDTPPLFALPAGDSAEDPRPEKDWYCFECHSGGIAIPCSACFRIYHHSCLSLPVVDETAFLCPVCQSLDAPCAIDEQTLNKQLDGILTWVHGKGGEGFALPSGSVDLSGEQYRLLIARDMDLCAIKTNLNTARYPTPRHFLADFQLLCHNICLLHGKSGTLSRLAEQLLKEVRDEILGLEVEGGRPEMVPYVGGVDGRGPVKRAPPPRKGDTPKRPRIPGPSSLKPLDHDGVMNEGWTMDDGFKKLLMDLQRHWLIEYQQSREKLLVELTEKLHQEFLSDQQKIRTELLTQFKDELDATRQELEQKYRDTLKQEMHKIEEKHRKNLANTKKKQWCWQCEAEAIYHCCWNTAYCSVDCQQAHWPTHRKYCRRKKGAAAGPGAVPLKE